MTIEEDEITIDNLKGKLTLAQKSFTRTVTMFNTRIRRDSIGITNAPQKRSLLKKGNALLKRIRELEQMLNDAVENAGVPAHRRRKNTGAKK
jgi:hypothetical protein